MSSSDPPQHFLTAQLLREIEATGKRRDQVNLLALCNQNRELYGKPASDRRRALQTKFCDIKRKSAKNYKNFLIALGISPGAGLLAEIAEEEAKAEGKYRGRACTCFSIVLIGFPFYRRR